MNLRGRFTLAKVRDPILFVVGVAGLVYETIFRKSADPTLTIAFTGLAGAPLFTKSPDPPPPPPAAAPPSRDETPR